MYPLKQTVHFIWAPGGDWLFEYLVIAKARKHIAMRIGPTVATTTCVE